MDFENLNRDIRSSFIVYEARSGKIVFIYSPTGDYQSEEIEADALKLAAWQGHNVEYLRVLKVEGAFEGGQPQRVDVASKTLVPDLR
jgi:hypothetical protein